MRWTRGLHRGRAVHFGLAASLALLFTVVFAARVSAATPNLSGFWVNSADTRSGYTLRESTDGSVLNAEWAGLPPHQTLRGHFKGTLNTSGDVYDGTFNVTEGSVSVSGSGTFALRSSFFASFPTIEVTLTPDNGQASTFTLKVFSALPVMVPNGVTDEVTCPSDKPCSGYVDVGDPTGSQSRLNRDGAAQMAKARPRVLGKTHFSLKAGKSRRITVSLNRKGRALLKKRGSLKVQVVIHMNRSSGLPTATKVGVVTLR